MPIACLFTFICCFPLSTLPDTDGAAGFVCSCGKCTIEEYLAGECLQDVGCNFKYLNTRAVNEQDREVLESKLIDDVKEMIVLFNDFRSLIIDSFEARSLHVPVTRVTDYVLGLGNLAAFGAKALTEEDEVKLKEARSILDVFSALRPYTSFFHYDIIEILIHKFGTQEDKVLLEEYVKSFNLYCERSVFQVPQCVFHNNFNIKKKDVTVKAFKYDNDNVATPSLGDVKTVCRKIAKILGIEVWSLQLCSVEKGCVCLLFWIPSRVADKVFPVSPTQQADFNQLGIRVLKQADDAPTTEEKQTLRYGEHFLN